MKKIIIFVFVAFSFFIIACTPRYMINHSAPVKPVCLPEDGAAHYWAQSEWWYYTGHLIAEDEREFGYELTFFKRITNEDKVPDFFISIPAFWLKDVGMLGHFAVTDLKNNRFKAEAIDDFIFNNSKADEKKYDVMIGDWTVREEHGKHILCAEMNGYKIELELEALKPVVFNGQDGIMNKGGSHSNYYYSFTRMKTSGTLTVEGQPLMVKGISWMDHEYGTMKLLPWQSGWDWFSVQLDNNCELMIYLIRNDKDKVIDIRGGTFVLPNGKITWINDDDIEVKVLDYWYGEKTDSKYPALWEITIKSQNLKLDVNPMLAQQELDLKPMPYWEGSVKVNGTYNGQPVRGKGYVELVGYSKKYPLVYM